MYLSQVKEINESLKRTGKAIIAIGCSFVQGQGAVDDELYTNYKWNYEGHGRPLTLDLTPEQKVELLKKYPSVVQKHGKIDFTFMEYDNAFVNVLCNKYFKGEYTPINLGQRGCGNRASIKDLYFFPEINWELMKEVIVIYCPSGLERFDFVNDAWNDHFHWKAMWPRADHMDEKSNRRKLWEGYGNTVYSDKFEVIEQISHIQELMTWCKLHNAKMIITPGFDRRYTVKYFTESLKQGISRDDDGNIKHKSSFPENKATHLVKLWPWDTMFKPDGFETFVDLVMDKENLSDTKDHFFQFLGKGSLNNWITPCAHPSAKAHDLFAQKLFEEIIK
jgi:hypothetical protein